MNCDKAAFTEVPVRGDWPSDFHSQLPSPEGRWRAGPPGMREGEDGRHDAHGAT